MLTDCLLIVAAALVFGFVFSVLAGVGVYIGDRTYRLCCRYLGR